MVAAIRITLRKVWSSRFSGLCRLLSEAKHREDYDDSCGRCMFRRRIHSFLTRFVLVCLHEIVSIGKQRRSHWPGTINQAQPIVPSKCGYSIPSCERHAVAWFAPRQSRGTITTYTFHESARCGSVLGVRIRQAFTSMGSRKRLVFGEPGRSSLSLGHVCVLEFAVASGTLGRFWTGA